MYISDDEQFSFDKGWFLAPQLDKEHKLIKITEAINWDRLTKALSKFYCSISGRPTKPTRAKIGLLILKHLFKKSDRDTVDLLKRDLYAQYLCNISAHQSRQFIHSSTLTVFRKQIGKEGVEAIEKELMKMLKAKGLLRGKKLITDTTVSASPIQYPTDINLLEKSRKKIIKLLDEAKFFGAKTYRTYRRVARKTFIRYQKLRRTSKVIRRKTQKKLIQFTQRNLRQLKEAISDVASHCVSDYFSPQKRFLSKAKDITITIETVLKQQKALYKGEEVKERIVSLWATHIRPMVRGKFPVEVEFGPKILFMVKNGFLFPQKLFFENVHDSLLLPHSISDYTERFGHLPTQLAADRGFHSPENNRLCLEQGIKKVAIQRKGKRVSNQKDPPFKDRLKRQRCALEAKVSLAKRCFGWDRINYRIPDGEEMWLRLGAMAMNLSLASGYG